jgi:hypothetical protein
MAERLKWVGKAQHSYIKEKTVKGAFFVHILSQKQFSLQYTCKSDLRKKSNGKK